MKKNFSIVIYLKIEFIPVIKAEFSASWLFQDSLMNRKFRRTAFIWSTNLWNIIMTLLSLLINLMRPCWIKALISSEKIFPTPNFWMVVYESSEKEMVLSHASLIWNNNYDGVGKFDSFTWISSWNWCFKIFTHNCEWKKKIIICNIINMFTYKILYLPMLLLYWCMQIQVVKYYWIYWHHQKA